MLLNVGAWLLKSVLILGIFHFVLPTIVNAATRNSWAKLPVLIVLGLVAGVFMAWLHYVPYLLFFLWLAFNKYTLAAMLEPKFESEAQMTIRKPVFYVSSYTYIVVACVSAWFLQVEIVQGSAPNAVDIPLWRYLFGI